MKNALYGLDQSGKEWNDELHQWLSGVAVGGSKVLWNPVCMWNKLRNLEEEFFADLNTKYSIQDQGRLHNYLGIQVETENEGMRIHQTKYAKEVLERFGFENARGSRSPMATNLKLQSSAEGDKEPGIEYREAIGSLMYLATSIRPDLAYCVGYHSKFTEKPTCAHGRAVKRVLRYLAATVGRRIYFRPEAKKDTSKFVKIEGFCDADWGNCPDTRKSVTGNVMKVAGGPVAWAARRQSIVAQSTAEAENVAACEACQEGRALVNVVMETLPDYSVKLSLGIDNQAALSLAEHPTYSRKTRHIELGYHYEQEQVAQGAVKLWKVEGENNPADVFTKPLNSTRLNKLVNLIGMQPEAQMTLREIRRTAYAQIKLAGDPKG